MRGIMIAVSICLIIFVLLLSIGYVVSQTVETERFNLNENGNVSIAIIGDLHYPHSFLSLNELAAKIEGISPDVVVFTGDIMDASANKENIRTLGTFFSRISERFLCYGVIGNHEIGSELLDLYVATARNSGVNLLLNQCAVAHVKGGEIAFMGLSDGYSFEEKTFSSLKTATTRILLTHRPEKFEEYASAPDSIKPTYVFAGHAHGGIARIGDYALYAPDQGLFPKYTSGLYENNNARMVVTRGLGISSVDFRFFNKYHLPVVRV